MGLLPSPKVMFPQYSCTNVEPQTFSKRSSSFLKPSMRTYGVSQWFVLKVCELVAFNTDLWYLTLIFKSWHLYYHWTPSTQLTAMVLMVFMASMSPRTAPNLDQANTLPSLCQYCAGGYWRDGHNRANKGFRSSNSAFSQMGPTWAPCLQSLLSLIYILHLCTGP